MGIERQLGEAKQGKKKEYLLRLVGGNSMDWVPPGLSEKRLGILERSLDMIPATPLIGSVVDPGKPSPCQLPSGPEQPSLSPSLPVG
ncbi:hypothetical protein ANANG_G00287460 [Anguilla anguilla]|uniref:Uncharacterized protein n=1 Tax=Anguilla anguilla TaxID=7936 RepID=A0A9D3RIY0_ANGAN|nr:hypothetical protein ANANG_G00287460 [Anguilla anguilla]